MTVIIRELDESNLQDVNRVDGAFVVDARLVLAFSNGEITYTIEPLTPYTKHYPVDEIDYRTYIANPAKAVFLAYIDGQIAGQIVLRQSWNQFAYIEWVVVDARFRKLGIGRALMDRAISWAKAKALPGMMLETQDNNVAACQFYQRCGFKLGGFDQNLYHNFPDVAHETALYWYQIFGKDEG